MKLKQSENVLDKYQQRKQMTSNVHVLINVLIKLRPPTARFGPMCSREVSHTLPAMLVV